MLIDSSHAVPHCFHMHPLVCYAAWSMKIPKPLWHNTSLFCTHSASIHIISVTRTNGDEISLSDWLVWRSHTLLFGCNGSHMCGSTYGTSFMFKSSVVAVGLLYIDVNDLHSPYPSCLPSFLHFCVFPSCLSFFPSFLSVVARLFNLYCFQLFMLYIHASVFYFIKVIFLSMSKWCSCVCLFSLSITAWTHHKNTHHFYLLLLIRRGFSQ